MKRAVAIAFAAAFLGAAQAQLPPGNTGAFRSVSGQFVVQAAPMAGGSADLARLASDPSYLTLEPALVVVSCERLKQKLWRELGVAGSWRGTISLDLHRAKSANEVVTIISEKSPHGWNYRVKLPDVLLRERFILAMTQVLLAELANRNSSALPAEIPAWLTEGLAGYLGASSQLDVVLTRPIRSNNGLTLRMESTNKPWANPLEKVWPELRAQTPLTFAQLSWPTEGQLDGVAGDFYRANAQLLVSRLLRLENGRQCLQTLLKELPRYYNWQLAFQAAFRRHFQSPLEVEKWWALQVVQFTGRELTQTWALDESWRKFDEILCLPVEIRAEENELPLHSEVNLQASLREWDYARQNQMLQRKLTELSRLRLRVAPELVSLVDDYRSVLQTYLQKRNKSSGFLFFKKRSTPIHDRLAEETIQQLNALDAVRTVWRPASPATAPAEAQDV